MKRGGAGRGQGRKPNPQPSIRKSYRWTAEEYKKIQEAVEQTGRLESEIVKSAVMNEVNQLLRANNHLQPDPAGG